jgi:hypothetical protein
MPSSLEGWTLPTPTSPSFRDLFKLRVDTPPDTTLSYGNKKTSKEEENASGPALHKLAILNLDDLSLSHPEHNLTWARNRLAEYAPLDLIGWDSRGIEIGLPSFIQSEANTLSFVEAAYLGRALCAGWFLYCHSARHDPSPCPVTRFLHWHDTSSYSSSGRPDRTLFFNQKQALLCEGKTAKVCKARDENSRATNVMHELHRFVANFDAGPDVSTWLQHEEESTWESKGRQFILQVYNICMFKKNMVLT